MMRTRLRSLCTVLWLALWLSACVSPSQFIPRGDGTWGQGGRGGSGQAPLPTRDLTLNAACSQTEEDGFREQATLRVTQNEVQALAWRLWVGKRGSCQFDLQQFQQTKRSPHIELAARDGSQCKLMIWQDPRHVTLAHANCEQHCTKGIYEDAWPVMFEPSTGACSSH